MAEPWYENNREYATVRERARKEHYQTLTRGGRRNGLRWTHVEKRLLIVSDQPLINLALILERSYASVSGMSWRLRRGKI